MYSSKVLIIKIIQYLKVSKLVYFLIIYKNIFLNKRNDSTMYIYVVKYLKIL